MGTSVIKEKYHRLLAEWESGGDLDFHRTKKRTILELAALFRRDVQEHCRKPDGRPTSEIANFKIAMRPLKERCGRRPAKAFSPRKLKAVRVSEGGQSRL